MRCTPLLLAVLGLQLLSASSRAETAEEAAARRSVYVISPPADGLVIVSTSLGILIPYALASHIIHPRCPCNPLEVNSFDRPVIGNNSRVADVVSTVTAGLAIGVPVLLDWLDVGFGQTLLEDVVVFAEALTVNGAITTVFKYTVQRPLPLVYAGQANSQTPDGYTSFYSGHTSTTFAALSAAAMTVSLRYGFKGWLWFGVFAIGASVAAERVAAGQHFYTDVLVGAGAGLAVGTLVPFLHIRHPLDSVAVTPTAGGAALTWTHAF